MTRLAIAIVTLGVFSFVACHQAETPVGPTPAAPVGKRIEAPGGSYTLITAQELHGMLTKKDFLLVNVHVPYDGEIEKTDAFIPYDEITEHLDRLPARDARVALYCRRGNMSDLAVHALVRLGYTNLYDLEGGMTAWVAAGFPLQNP
jgi:rhodanese-related sulfurtransferase